MSTTRAPFLREIHGAYYHRDVPEPDYELARVGPGTPAGEWLRRFWHPFMAADELKDLPKRIRLLGEDLIAFRDKSGNYGVLELHCSHRGASLEFGQISQKGIRCCYHGWLFDVDGAILETPGEPPDSTLKDRLCHGAYPVKEHKGLLFVYMGHPDKIPELPVLDTYDLEGYPMVPGPSYIWPCNWVQVKENSMDAPHLEFLHTLPGSIGFTADLKIRAEWDHVETPIGLAYIDTRRKGDMVWVRIADFIPPNIHQFPPNMWDMEDRKDINRPLATTWAVPLDDTHTMTIGFRRGKNGRIPPRDDPGFGQTDVRPYEERQKVPGDYDAQTSQREIAVHGMEHLGATDRGVTMLRSNVRKGIRMVEDDADPPGLDLPKKDGVVTTYSHDVVLIVPPAPTPEEDKKLLRETGRKVIMNIIEKGW